MIKGFQILGRKVVALKIAVSGSSGLIGSALVPYLKSQGHEVLRLVRRQPNSNANEVQWNPASGKLDAEALEGTQAAINLSGANIGAKRWNDNRKKEIHESRIDSTRLLSETLARLEPRPKVLASASALGYYGDQGNLALREDASAGRDFLAESTKQWEDATSPASEAGIRVVNMRFGLALSSEADLIKRQLPAFKMGVGGKLGNGRQYMSWIHINDLIRAIAHILVTEELSGSVNLSSPNPVTNAEFTRAFGRALSRPAIFTIPKVVLKIAFGEIADSMMASTRMEPAKLMESSFEFEYPQIEAALREVLGKS